MTRWGAQVGKGVQVGKEEGSGGKGVFSGVLRWGGLVGEGWWFSGGGLMGSGWGGVVGSCGGRGVFRWGMLKVGCSSGNTQGGGIQVVEGRGEGGSGGEGERLMWGKGVQWRAQVGIMGRVQVGEELCVHVGVVQVRVLREVVGSGGGFKWGRGVQVGKEEGSGGKGGSVGGSGGDDG
ncbi:acanthoscurrin-2-like [Symsagittifera roscoffensis]|uniref:acanthoscurrin-2-like n=1 Tax=Symsagittifera roscoffensis TaxID=84072 RepID=UPI00307B6F70